jgi:hypothetical protein
MSADKKTSWGSPSDWGTAIGIMIAAIGLLGVISSVWTPDAASSAATGFLGKGALVPSVVILVVGLVVAGVYRFLIKPKA